jgi:PAS domain S-box-containing protein
MNSTLLDLEQAPMGIAIFRGPEMTVEMANPAYLQLIERAKEDFVGKSLYIGLPEVTESVKPLLDKVMQTGQPHYGNEFRVPIFKNNIPEDTWFNFVYQPLRNDQNIVNGVMVMATDVTAQVRARHQLQESEAQFRNLVTQTPIAMMIFKGPDLIIDLANETVLKTMWRRTADEVMGKKLLDVFPELSTQPFPALLKKVYDTGVSHTEKEALAYVDGPDGMKRFYLDFTYAPLFDIDKKVYGIMANVYDVTERKEIEIALRLSEEKFRVLADSMPQFVWTADLEGNFNYFSRGLQEYTGFSPKEMHDQSWLQVLHPADREQTYQQWMNAVKNGEPYIFEHRFRKYDGTYRWQLSRAIPQRDADGHILMWVGTSTDVHDNKTFIDHLELQVQERTKALQHSNEELKKTNSELEQFAYVASHDLQEPLRKIQTFSSRLIETESAVLSERGKDYFSRMQAASKRMQQLIEDLLSFSRVNNNGDQLLEQVDLTAILLHVKDQLNDQIEAKKAQISYDPLPVLSVITFQIEQLFTNLLSNALKFSRAGVPPVINIHLDNKVALMNGIPHYKIIFSDNGIGFDPQFNERIFQVFQRLHTRNVFEGTGIGLAICKKIMDNHHGYIFANGTQNEGASFSLLFPVG